jgi:hypothetical protein
MKLFSSIVLPLLVISISGCYSKEPEKTGLEGKLMPSFNILLTDSVSYQNTNDISRGQPVVFLYIGTHCPYSRTQIEEIIEEMSKLEKIKFYILTVSPYKEMKKLIAHYQLSKYPNITTGFDNTIFFANYFKITGVPFMAIYGKDKKLVQVFEGKIYSKQIIKALQH